MTRAGAMEKSIGFVAASAYEMILATGDTPNLFAASGEESSTAAAPSFRVDAFPAVTVPSKTKRKVMWLQASKR